MSSPFTEQPEPFLEVRLHRLQPLPGLTGLCAGYEEKAWRGKQLASHLMKWLPEFALRHSELTALGPSNAVELLGRAAATIYATDKFQNRGEFGELLLHVAIRQCFKTIPAITKYFYKDSRNDTVKGFDAVHVVDAGGVLELWLGEVKFYNEITGAIAAVVAEIDDHLGRDYLRNEFAAITNKVDDTLPQAQSLKKLLHPNTSLDEVFSSVCIPVLLTYDSPVISSFDQASAAFKTDFDAEVLRHYGSFQSKLSSRTLPAPLRIHLFLLPLHEKASFVVELHDALKRMQAIS